MSCGPTALCAITHRTPQDVLNAIKEAARRRGEVPDDWDLEHTFNPAYIFIAAELLLGTELQHPLRPRPAPARNIRRDPLTPALLALLKPIRRIVVENISAHMLLCTAVDPSRPNEVTHTFALDHGLFFDSFSDGRLRGANDLPAEVADWLVFRVRACLPATTA